MRLLSFSVSTIVTVFLVFLLNHKWGSVPPIGKFLSPQQGFWQNAEPADYNFSQNLSFQNLKGKVSVYFDDRLVPHVFAENDEDIYFVQGYLHAKFRLWQMEIQTMAAAGRISEVAGNTPAAIQNDREQRRSGMVFGAENALKAMIADSVTKKSVDAYTKGVNAYINTLTESELPLEYKLLDYEPEQWSNLKICLFFMQMNKELAGFERDLEFTNAKAVFGNKELNILYPQISDSSVPFVPKGTAFTNPDIDPVAPATADSLYFGKDTTVNEPEVTKPNRLNGSNNWAVSGQKTKSGAPILCNDPHLGLTLPSIWYEMQLNTPTMNVYGATFPGAPCVIIGFNDSTAFGVTSSMRDVKDYYQIRFKDASKKEYWFNNQWTPAQLRIEQIKIRGAATLNDTVAYTAFGPVMYDGSFTQDSSATAALAVRWVAHYPANPLQTFLKLDKAKNYTDYVNAIRHYDCPGQNFVFASKSGDIALWHEGKFPAYWKGQGLYIMPGEDSSYLWQGYIPKQENPHILNPPEGYVESANQRPVDSSYPYFIPGNYIVPRGIRINQQLRQMQQITPQDMMRLQNDTYDVFAASAVPMMVKYTDRNQLDQKELNYYNIVKHWDYNVTANSKSATIFKIWWDYLDTAIWKDEFARIKSKMIWPDNETLLEQLLKDSTFKYVDDINTPEAETLQQQITASLKKASIALQREENTNGLLWWRYKNTTIFHLLKTAVLPFARTGLQVGGWRTTIDAITHDHGPSWRMIVQLSNPTVAYGVYPGGQSGNPGSKFYDNFIDTWATGKYYTLWMMKENESNSGRIKWKMVFTNA